MDHLLVRGVVEPWRAGRQVSYRPPAWEARSRAGAVEVPATADVLVVEGSAQEEPFLAAERPWARADVVVHGTPTSSGPGLVEWAVGSLSRGLSVEVPIVPLMRTTRTERRLTVVRAGTTATPPDEPESREDYWRRMQELRAELARLRAG